MRMKQFFLQPLAALFLSGSCFLQAFAAEEVLLETEQTRVTSTDFEANLVRIPQEHRMEVLASKERIRNLLENLLINKTLAAQARSAGLDREPAVGKELELATDRVLAQARVNRAVEELALPNFDVRAQELYKVNIASYTQPEKVHVSHILVEAKKRTPEEALKLIQEVRAKAVAGKPFEALAQEYSDDPSAKQNKGDLGFFAAGKMVKPFSDAAFAMTKSGEISDPVKTDFGYHILQFHEKLPKHVRPFEEVKQEILNELKNSYIAEYRKKLVGVVLADPSIKLNEAAVDRFLTHLDIANVEKPTK